MQCHNCNHTIAAWHSFCPHCQHRLQSISYSTISDTPTETLEEISRRKLLRTILQFALFAVAIIAVASAIHLSSPKIVPTKQETASLQPSTTPTIVPAEPIVTPVTTESPKAVEANDTASKGSIAEAQPISIFSQADIARIAQNEPVGRTSAQPTQRLTALQIPTITVPIEKKATKVDEALPKNLAKITKETSAPPAPVAAPAIVEPSLELDAGSVALNPNTGLLSIKSYIPARIYIDGIFSGVTPRSVKLLAGEHVISLLADGYQEYARKVKVNGQQQMGILASMSKK